MLGVFRSVFHLDEAPTNVFWERGKQRPSAPLLPPELWFAVAKLLSALDLKSFSRTSKIIRQQCIPFLFRTIVLDAHRCTVSATQNLVHTPQLFLHTQKIVLRHGCYGRCSKGNIFTVEVNFAHCKIALLSPNHPFVNAKTLCLEGGSLSSGTLALLSLLPIQRLELHNVTLDVQPFQSTPFSLAPIHELHVSNVKSSQTEMYAAIVAELGPQLCVLELVGNHADIIISSVQGLPMLSRLKMFHLEPSGSYSLEPLAVRRALDKMPNLESLLLPSRRNSIMEQRSKKPYKNLRHLSIAHPDEIDNFFSQLQLHSLEVYCPIGLDPIPDIKMDGLRCLVITVDQFCDAAVLKAIITSIVATCPNVQKLDISLLSPVIYRLEVQDSVEQHTPHHTLLLHLRVPSQVPPTDLIKQWVKIHILSPAAFDSFRIRDAIVSIYAGPEFQNSTSVTQRKAIHHYRIYVF